MTNKTNGKRALRQAIAIAGSQSELARRLHVKQSTVWSWLNETKRVPAEVCGQIETATQGRVTKSDIRPDIWPPSPKP